MTYYISQVSNKTIVKISGSLNNKAILELEKDLHSKLNGICDITFECSELDYISSSCIRFLLILHNEIRAKKGTMTINNLHPDLQDMIQWAGFDNEFMFTHKNENITFKDNKKSQIDTKSF